MGKEVENGCELPLTAELVRHINNEVLVLLGVMEQYSDNDKGENYKNKHVTHE